MLYDHEQSKVRQLDRSPLLLNGNRFMHYAFCALVKKKHIFQLLSDPVSSLCLHILSCIFTHISFVFLYHPYIFFFSLKSWIYKEITFQWLKFYFLFFSFVGSQFWKQYFWEVSWLVGHIVLTLEQFKTSYLIFLLFFFFNPAPPPPKRKIDIFFSFLFCNTVT